MNHYHTFKCWVHSVTQSNEPHSELLRAQNTREAAETFAEIHCNYKNNQFDMIKIAVKESNNHYAETFYYLIEVEIRPIFKGRIIGGEGQVRSTGSYSGEF